MHGSLVVRLLFLREFVFAYTAKRALEVCEKIFPLGAGSDTAFGISFFLVIDPTAYIAYVLHVLVTSLVIFL